jgi:large subunit ribosomal protein L13
MRTFSAKKEDVEKKWHLIDADGKALGRLSSEVAKILRGKNKPIYTPHVDTGDHVVVINAKKILLTGKKTQDKIYYRHTNYPGGLKSITAGKILKKRPESLIEEAVRGMLPRTRLGRAMFKKLKVYPSNEHPHAAQKPEVKELTI